jgi:hypothetical protein
MTMNFKLQLQMFYNYTGPRLISALRFVVDGIEAADP